MFLLSAYLIARKHNQFTKSIQSIDRFKFGANNIYSIRNIYIYITVCVYIELFTTTIVRLMKTRSLNHMLAYMGGSLYIKKR